MLDRIQKRKESGFTIVEVMIVLAIAGLVILIVFLAVPALQRNSRNTQRNNDVSALLAGVNEYMANNNGRLTGLTGTVLVTNVKTGYYEGAGTGAGQVTTATGAQPALQANNAANDRVVVVTGAKCGTAGATVAGPTRAVAAQFLRETAGGFIATCQDG